MSISENKYDALESIIYSDGIRIKTIDFHPELDLMLIVLNTARVLHQKLSQYPLLRNASLSQLEAYELIADGVGVHWPMLDEDLSLKGFLSNALRNLIFDAGAKQVA